MSKQSEAKKQQGYRTKRWMLGVAMLLVAGLVSWGYLIWRYILS